MGETRRAIMFADERPANRPALAQIPPAVLSHPDLSFGAKVLFAALHAHAWPEDHCWPSQEELARDVSCTVRQVQRLLEPLLPHFMAAEACLRDAVQQGEGRGVLELAPLPGAEVPFGDVTLKVPPTLAAEVDIETSSGDIETDFEVAVTRHARDHMTGRIGDGGGKIALETGSGGIKLVKGGS